MHILSTNLGTARPNPALRPEFTGHHKQPVDQLVVFDPGPRGGEHASGVVGDYIGDLEHHGGDMKAVYAVGREELDAWSERLGSPLANGWMGENLTTAGVDLPSAVVGSRWEVGTALLQVSLARIPCRTFQAVAGREGWIKEFTLAGGAGTYLRVLRGGTIRPGDELRLVHVPEHGVTARELFRARTLEPGLAGHVLRAAGDLDEHNIEILRSRAG
ncbi:MOSC domain-containing protein [Luteococcus peritonei]|uniref:MOSC domain-containing protein n=1 Tax=Luteococcus peritonei TaxID=88874 RepID=A0ABW4RR63_9ACTN